MNFAKFLRTPFYYRTPLVAASEGYTKFINETHKNFNFCAVLENSYSEGLCMHALIKDSFLRWFIYHLYETEKIEVNTGEKICFCS